MVKIDSENCTGCTMSEGLTEAVKGLSTAVDGLNKWRGYVSGGIAIAIGLFGLVFWPMATGLRTDMTRISDNQIRIEETQKNIQKAQSEDKRSVQNSIYNIKDKIIAEINKQK